MARLWCLVTAFLASCAAAASSTGTSHSSSTLKTSSTKSSTSLKNTLATSVLSTSEITSTSSSTKISTSTKPSKVPSSRASQSNSTPKQSLESVSTTSIPGCPIITITTSTFSVNYTIYPNTTTEYYPLYTESTTVSTSSYASTSYVYAATVSAVSTSTVTSLVVPPASKTVTVHTKPAFTSILCEPTYYARSTTTTTSTVTATDPYTIYSGTSDPATTYTSYSYVYKVTVTVISSLSDTLTTSVYSTTTITTTRPNPTRPNPTSTVYDACQTNNIASRMPGGAYIYFAYPAGGYTLEDQVTKPVGAAALDPVDCCALCQANSSCAAGSYNTLTTNFIRCYLYIKKGNNQTRDPTFVGAIGNDAVNEVDYYLSNSGCGQYQLFSY